MRREEERDASERESQDQAFQIEMREANDYRLLKSALLKRFQLTSDGFRHKFRVARPETGESGHQFAARLDNYLSRWIDLAEANKTYDGLKDLLLREQFTDGCGRELALILRERQPRTIQAMAEIAEQYLEARGGLFGQPINFGNKFSKHPPNTNRTQETPSRALPQVVGKPNSVTCFLCHRVGHLARNCRFSTSFKGNTPLKCYRCQKTGHVARYCRQDTDKCAGLFTMGCSNCQSKGTSRAINSVGPDGVEEKPDVGACMITKISESLDECCISRDGSQVTLKCGHHLPIMSAALDNSLTKKMPVSTGMVGPHRISVLRDSGCSGVVIKREYVSPDQLTGNMKTCVLIDGTVRTLPVALINVNTPFFCGVTHALCMDNPIYDLILGNITSRAPEDPDQSWTEHPSPACAVETRSQVKDQDKPFRLLKIPETTNQIITTENMKTFQQEDPTLYKARELAKEERVNVSNNQAESSFHYKKALLYRKFCSPTIEHGDCFTQLVVPKICRQHVMRQAHENLLGGHQGAKKTTDKVLSKFWWPGVTADITRYCRSCDICQRTVQKGRVTKVPLGRMPLIEAPFERIAVDIVGPIFPMSKDRNRYILTIIDFATRYPEAVPLPNIEAERVAEALVKVFSRIGMPKEMLSDRGSQFTSEVMKQVSTLLSIRQLMTSPYHPAFYK
ncbi:uncharacterized protein LOC117104684 [Anneissia japonica]|uniref:uncharacterized protein LOC117104684 n=1 Tax=Anneissia japonica TaxID=1529436 RepID=UPI001425A75A|nr:uncharacterized protein LOC117104684 [Anneissia japonica]